MIRQNHGIRAHFAVLFGGQICKETLLVGQIVVPSVGIPLTEAFPSWTAAKGRAGAAEDNRAWGMEAAGRGGGGGRVGAAPVNPASTHGLPTPRPRGAPHAAPRRRPPPARASPSRLDVMWAAGLARRRGRGPSGRSRGARSAPCALRRAPGPYAPPPPPPPRHIWKRSARLPPARRAGGEGAGAGAAAGWAGGGERGALARPVSPSRCLCRNSSCQNGARRGAARSGGVPSCPRASGVAGAS